MTKIPSSERANRGFSHQNRETETERQRDSQRGACIASCIRDPLDSKGVSVRHVTRTPELKYSARQAYRSPANRDIRIYLRSSLEREGQREEKEEGEGEVVENKSG